MIAGRYIGVMSGTSLDGVDVVLAAINNKFVAQQENHFLPYPQHLRQRILAVCQGQPTTLHEIGLLDAQLGELYAQAIIELLAKVKLSASDITAIGCHGQTVWHEPESDMPFTMQIGDNNRVAALTGITTVGDFRRRDIAYGGQGAPLVPAFHLAVLGHSVEKRVILNIGGIANISLLLPGIAVKGYDTGPGNMLLDSWNWIHNQTPYDDNGKWAATGTVNATLLKDMLSDPYFSRSAPKSTGREYFNTQWLNYYLARVPNVFPEDVQATLVELTVISIVQQIQLNGGCERLLVCGGGARNGQIMHRLASLLPGTEVATTDKYGLSGDDMEALAFAWLAARTIANESGNLPSVTGASRETVLGAIYPTNPR